LYLSTYVAGSKQSFLQRKGAAGTFVHAAPATYTSLSLDIDRPVYGDCSNRARAAAYPADNAAHWVYDCYQRGDGRLILNLRDLAFWTR